MGGCASARSVSVSRGAAAMLDATHSTAYVVTSSAPVEAATVRCMGTAALPAGFSCQPAMLQTVLLPQEASWKLPMAVPSGRTPLTPPQPK